MYLLQFQQYSNNNLHIIYILFYKITELLIRVLKIQIYRSIFYEKKLLYTLLIQI